MNAIRRFAGTCSIAACAAVLLLADRASACAVCFGDPESPMAKGAVAGVLVLIGVVGAVLLGVAATSLHCIRRGRYLARLEQGGPPLDDSQPV